MTPRAVVATVATTPRAATSDAVHLTGDRMTSCEPREEPPVGASSWDDALTFRVWALRADSGLWVCVGAFRYLPEALDFVSYCHSRECDVVFQDAQGCRAMPAPERIEIV